MTDEPPTTGPDPKPETSTPPVSKAVTTVTAGTLIMGTYEIEKLINSGGMGEVYRGRNIHNDEPVAIKIVLPSLAHDPKIVALFQKESTVLSRLAHEAIVRYHVFTNDPTIGRPCMVMEFVSGTALSDRIEQGPMPLDDVKVMLRRVASGLDKAHRAGVVHRDLSPDNVILEEGAVEHAKLIDFGIAKSANFGSGTLLQGQFAGKFNWVSPEQLGAFGGVVDGRSDIYSLGLIVAGASRGAVLQMGASIVDAVSKRASVPALDGVYPELVPLLNWMLEPDPSQRVESMAKVIAALDNPALIPGREAAPPPAPDPNRTVIEPLPMQTSAPITPVAAEAQSSQPPTGWDVPSPRETSIPPEGATVLAAHPLTGGPVPLTEAEDISPFGAPAAESKAAPAAMPVAKAEAKGKGGMIGVLAVLAVAAGGAGVYFSGVLDGPKPGTPVVEQKAEADPAPTDDTKKAEDVATAAKASEEAAKADADAAAKAETEAKAAADAEAAAKAEADAKAATDAKAEAEAAKQAEAEAAAKAAATEARSQAEAIAAARSMADAAKTEADAAATSAETASLAEVENLAGAAQAAAAKAKAAADAANTGLQAATKAGLLAKGVASASDGIEDVLAKAGADAKAAGDSATAAEAAAAKAAKTASTAAETEAARLADEKAKEDALKADPVARQQAFFDGFAPPPCVHVRLIEAKAKGFALDGFAVDTKPLEDLTTAWASATEVTPDIAVHLINEEQCAALDFMNAHKATPLSVTLTSGGEAVKSGASIEGVIKGLPNQNFALLVVSGAGAATNLKDFVTAGEDGTASFKFALKLLDGQPPAPHVLLAVTADEALVAMLAKLKPGTSIGGTRGLLPFMDKQLANAGVAAQVGLGFFRLEN